MEYKKDKQGRFYIDKIIAGKRCMLRAPTKKELDKKVRAWMDEQASAKEEQAQGPLYEEVAKDWWEQKVPTLKHGTIICYKPAYNRALLEFSGTHMVDITPDVIAQYMGQLQRKGFAGKTIANAKSVLQMIFNHWRFCSRWPGNKPNPVIGYRLPAHLPKEERLPPSEAAIALVKSHTDGFGFVPSMFAYTGMRLGEANALQWADIDFDRNVIHITKSVSWHGNVPVIGTPKTKNAVRDIPLLLPLRQILLPLKGQPEEYVLSGSTQPLSQTQYKNAWSTYCHSIGLVTHEEVTWGKTTRWIYKPTVTAHQFRHDFASCLYEAGIGELEAQQLLGHADIATTRKIYTHLRKRQMDEAASTLNAFFTQNPRNL